jgi:hypothetical protein
VTLEHMQQQFARAMRQEISFAELETYLKKYNLLPSSFSAAAGQPAAAATAGQQRSPPPPLLQQQQGGKDSSGGLEDMQTIEMALPSPSGYKRSGSDADGS